MVKLRLRNRLWLMFALGTAFVLLALFYIRYYVERPIGSGPAGPPVDIQKFSRKWTDREVLVIGIGDSITAGLGAKSPSHCYFQRVIKNPPDEFDELQSACLSSVIPNLQYRNLAVSGSTSDDHLLMLQQQLEVQDPAVFGIVFMTSGGNDLIHSYGRMPPRECAIYGATFEEAEPWIAAFDQRLDAMLQLIRQRFPGGCEIFLADIYDPTDGVGDAPSIYLPHWEDGLEIHAKYNQIIHDAATEFSDVHLVRLYDTFLGHGSHCRQFWRATYDQRDPYYWFYTNIEDPNDRGYDAIRRVFLNTIADNSLLVQDQSLSDQ